MDRNLVARVTSQSESPSQAGVLGGTESFVDIELGGRGASGSRCARRIEGGADGGDSHAWHEDVPD